MNIKTKMSVHFMYNILTIWQHFWWGIIYIRLQFNFFNWRKEFHITTFKHGMTGRFLCSSFQQTWLTEFSTLGFEPEWFWITGGKRKFSKKISSYDVICIFIWTALKSKNWIFGPLAVSSHVLFIRNAPFFMYEVFKMPYFSPFQNRIGKMGHYK